MSWLAAATGCAPPQATPWIVVARTGLRRLRRLRPPHGLRRPDARDMDSRGPVCCRRMFCGIDRWVRSFARVGLASQEPTCTGRAHPGFRCPNAAQRRPHRAAPPLRRPRAGRLSAGATSKPSPATGSLLRSSRATSSKTRPVVGSFGRRSSRLRHGSGSSSAFKHPRANARRLELPLGIAALFLQTGARRGGQAKVVNRALARARERAGARTEVGARPAVSGDSAKQASGGTSPPFGCDVGIVPCAGATGSCEPACGD